MGEGQNFEQWNFRMTNEKRSNVRVIAIENENWEDKVDIHLYQKMIIGKIASSAEYRLEKQFQNFWNFNSFQIQQFGILRNFLYFTIRKIKSKNINYTNIKYKEYQKIF